MMREYVEVSMIYDMMEEHSKEALESLDRERKDP
jgi:hypothetical protein